MDHNGELEWRRLGERRVEVATNVGVDYDKFFAALRKGKHTTFTSTLQAQLTP